MRGGTFRSFTVLPWSHGTRKVFLPDTLWRHTRMTQVLPMKPAISLGLTWEWGTSSLFLDAWSSRGTCLLSPLRLDLVIDRMQPWSSHFSVPTVVPSSLFLFGGGKREGGGGLLVTGNIYFLLFSFTWICGSGLLRRSLGCIWMSYRAKQHIRPHILNFLSSAWQPTSACWTSAERRVETQFWWMQPQGAWAL